MRSSSILDFDANAAKRVKECNIHLILPIRLMQGGEQQRWTKINGSSRFQKIAQ